MMTTGEPATDDAVLLREYAQRGSQSAFSMLVSRYINLVYSVARCAVGDAHLAEEVLQATFIILARKAETLNGRTVLWGWLCRTTRYVAANALAAERRRRVRERKAAMRSVAKGPELDAWAQIDPLLETALSKLGQGDHDALVLRFFEGKSLKEVGLAMGATEDAARMRVNRALGKMKKFFAKGGVVLSTAIIIKSVSDNAVQAAPAGLAQSIALANGSALTVSTSTLVNGALKLMIWTKMNSAIVSVAILLTTGAAVLTTVALAAPEFKNDTGWAWQFPPLPARWGFGGAPGMLMRLDRMTPNRLQVTLAYPFETRRDVFKFRPVAFSAGGQRFEFQWDGDATQDQIKMMMSAYSLDLNQVPHEAPAAGTQEGSQTPPIAFLGIEKLTSERFENVVAPALSRKLKEATGQTLSYPFTDKPYEFELTTLDGKRLTSKELRGKVILLAAWTTSNVPSLAAVTSLKEIYRKLDSNGLEIIGICHDFDIDQAKQSVAALGTPWANVLVPPGKQQRELWVRAAGIEWFPRLLLIDRQGILRVEPSAQTVEAEIMKIIDQP